MPARPALALTVLLAAGARAAGQVPVPIGPEFQVNSSAAAIYTVAAAGPNGTFAVVWNSGGDVFLRRYDAAGGTLGSEIQVSTSTAGWGGLHKALAFDAQGNFVVTWTGPVEGDDDSSGVAARRFDASGVPLDEMAFRVNTYTTGPQSWPSIAMETAGTFVVVWHGRITGAGDPGVFGQRYDAGGQQLGTEFRVNSATTAITEHPAVAADALGNFRHGLRVGSTNTGSGWP